MRVKILMAAGLAMGMAAAAHGVGYSLRPADRVTLTSGFWFDRLETNRLSTFEACWQKCNETPRFANFTNAARRAFGTFRGIPYDDSDVYKVMEGAAYIQATHPSDEMMKRMTALIDSIAAAQEPDGYLYTARTLGANVLEQRWRNWMGPTRWGNLALNHELYNLGHLYEAAVAWHRATGKTTLLETAVRSADLLDRTFGPGPTQLKGTSGHEEVELALVKLAQETEDNRYLALAHHFLEMRGRGKDNAQDHVPVAQQREAVGHAVRAGYLYCAMTDIAAIRGDTGYFKAIDAIWEDVVSKKMFITGGIGSNPKGEKFSEAYELPNNEGETYLETCGAIANALWNERLFRMTRDAKYADVLERIIYNGVIAGVSLSGDRFFYPNPLASRGKYQRTAWFSTSCCPVNIVRFLPQIPSFAYATDGTDIWINLFMSSEADFGDVKLKVETDYPWNGKVRFTVTPKTDGEVFALHVRIPGWARGEEVPSDLYVQTKPSSYDSDNGYRVINKAWRIGDSVELELPMPARRIRAHEKVAADRGRLAVCRGPLVYCAEGADNDGRAFDAVLPPNVSFEDDQTVHGGKSFHAMRASNGVKLIPYCLWGNREPGNDMQVWFRTEPASK